VRSFMASERFDVRMGDGRTVGTDFVYDYNGPAICVVTTGSPISDIGSRALILKPYDVDSLAQEMERAFHKCHHFCSRVETLDGGVVSLKDRPGVIIGVSHV